MTVTKSASAAERKRAQRRRDRDSAAAALRGDAGAFADARTAALLSLVPELIESGRRLTLAELLIELGRRGGVTVTATPIAMG